MSRDKDYVVQDDEIVIVDEFTGRLMPGRRYSDGLHQAIEAKENVKVNRESRTMATITFQNFFNKYTKKAGMTGTAMTEDAEFRQIYGMDVVSVPTNVPIARKDENDLVYRNKAAKYRAVIHDVIEANKRGQPVLVGTVSIEKSEELSTLLRKQGVKHQVLNAKFHDKEAEIIALAGEAGAVTIATNMAGRGTDIKLGAGVRELGGLKIIGTERHEARRIDNQLRGRSGRQGDPGISTFYVSLEDDLMRLFGSERAMRVVDMLGMKEDEPIVNGMLSRAIENAQKKVEGNNFSIRKHLLQYDQVMNEQREVIYTQRMKVLNGEDLQDTIKYMTKAVIEKVINLTSAEADAEDSEGWNTAKANERLMPLFRKPIITDDMVNGDGFEKRLIETLLDESQRLYALKEAEFTPAVMRDVERNVLLNIISKHWMDHIDDMDQMRQGITLRSYAQKDPLVDYKFLSYDMFDELNENIQRDTVMSLFNVQVMKKPERESLAKDMSTNMDESLGKQPVKRKEAKIGRNDTCTCGSGKKYKQCCGRG